MSGGLMHTLHLILYIIAVLCFAAATAGIGARINLLALGLLLWVLNPLITEADRG